MALSILLHPPTALWRREALAASRGTFWVRMDGASSLRIYIPPITLLPRPVGLHPHLVGVDHHGPQPDARQLPRGIERHRPGLEGHGRLRGKLVLLPQLAEARRRGRDIAARHHAAILCLDHEHAPLAVHVQSHVRFHRAALLLEFGAHCDPVVGRGPYRGGGQPAFIDTFMAHRVPLALAAIAAVMLSVLIGPPVYAGV